MISGKTGQRPQTIASFKKSIYRRVRYLGTVERIWAAIKHDARLRLPTGIELDVKPGDVMIDCGANIGGITSLFARTGAVVYAFEPHPLCFAILTRRFRFTPKVFSINAGAMDRPCKLTLRTLNAHHQWDAIDTTISASFTTHALCRDYSVTETQVECIDLETFIRSLQKRVRLLKLDIEGSEIAVLNRLLDTGTINLIDLVVVETHEKQVPSLFEEFTALRHRIEAAGFSDKIRLDWP